MHFNAYQKMHVCVQVYVYKKVYAFLNTRKKEFAYAAIG